MRGKTWKKAILLVVCLLVAQLAIGATIATAAPPACGPVYHYVRYGETLSSIGRLYGVDAYAIARANGLANPNLIYTGQMLLVPTCSYSGYYPSSTYNYSGYYYPQPYYYQGYSSCYPYYYCWSPYYLDP